MPRGGSWLRVFVGLMLAIIPPMFVLAAVALAFDTLLKFLNRDLLAVSVLLTVATWPAILAVIYVRMINDDYRSFVSKASRGRGRTEEDEDALIGRLASALEERNRQVAALAQQASLLPIEHDPGRLAGALVATARSVTGDPTWRLAIMSTELQELLRPGTYHGGDDGPEPVGDLEQWASLQTTEARAVRADGPWGAFVVVDVSSSDRLSAILYAPWEGRGEPTPAEVDLLTLLGQHAGTTLEHSLLYAQVRAQADELERLAAVQADFLRGVTHDLQTPLTSIGVLASELRAEERMPESARADLEAIGHQADRLRRMVSQLLVTSRIEAGALQPQTDVFAVQPVLERTWSALRTDRPLKLAVEGPPQLAVADPDRLEQVLWAVLDNAVKYSPPASPIGVTITSVDRALEIAISDRGIGMDPETRTHAFDQFFRSDRARKLAPDGSGVGLYAAAGLMAAMGGWIRIGGELGRGSVVTIHVPAEPSDSAE